MHFCTTVRKSVRISDERCAYRAPAGFPICFSGFRHTCISAKRYAICVAFRSNGSQDCALEAFRKPCLPSSHCSRLARCGVGVGGRLCGRRQCNLHSRRRIGCMYMGLGRRSPAWLQNEAWLQISIRNQKWPRAPIGASARKSARRGDRRGTGLSRLKFARSAADGTS